MKPVKKAILITTNPKSWQSFKKELYFNQTLTTWLWLTADSIAPEQWWVRKSSGFCLFTCNIWRCKEHSLLPFLLLILRINRETWEKPYLIPKWENGALHCNKQTKQTNITQTESWGGKVQQSSEINSDRKHGREVYYKSLLDQCHLTWFIYTNNLTLAWGGPREGHHGNITFPYIKFLSYILSPPWCH